ncbi:MAG: VOC family protein [Proteobacteria bacterium]|nr:VOC family protein [Pseudomonadota bacterium]
MRAMSNPRSAPAPATVPRGVQHVGLTVPDMVQAVTFFVEHLGCELLFCEGPFTLGASSAQAHQVDAGTVLVKLGMLRCAAGALLELFEYRAVDQRADPVRNVDNGGHHIAFQVDDIDAAAARLQAGGVRLCGQVNRSIGGPFEGLGWLYFLAPWGLQLELVQIPSQGLGYERSSGRRLYQPG